MVMISPPAYHFWKFLMKNMISTNSGLNNVITSGYSKICYDHFISMLIELRKGNYSMNVNLQNSQFYNIDQIALTAFIHNTNTLFYINK